MPLRPPESHTSPISIVLFFAFTRSVCTRDYRDLPFQGLSRSGEHLGGESGQLATVYRSLPGPISKSSGTLPAIARALG
jgi:hypothetical protein